MTQEMELRQKTWRDSLRHPLVLAAIILALGIALAGLFYAAANIVPESGAGDGTGAVSGYTISNIDWNVQSPADPDLVSTVIFDVAPTAGALDATEVWATIDGGTNWVLCTVVGTTWTCDFTALNITVLTAATLQIVALE